MSNCQKLPKRASNLLQCTFMSLSKFQDGGSAPSIPDIHLYMWTHTQTHFNML